MTISSRETCQSFFLGWKCSFLGGKTNFLCDIGSKSYGFLKRITQNFPTHVSCMRTPCDGS
jgi:hypothetical protein